jgi:hypothetical protein
MAHISCPPYQWTPSFCGWCIFATVANVHGYGYRLYDSVFPICPSLSQLTPRYVKIFLWLERGVLYVVAVRPPSPISWTS